MKLCDLTQFYSPLSGGVKRYVHEKIRYIQSATADEHALIIPGPKTELIEAERSRIYSIRSPLLSRTSRYRVLLNLRAIEEILKREQPQLIDEIFLDPGIPLQNVRDEHLRKCGLFTNDPLDFRLFHPHHLAFCHCRSCG